MSHNATSKVTVRPAKLGDAAVCGEICYRAFSTINATHNFPCDFPNEEVAIGVLSMMFSTPGLYCVVAESDGRILGSNVLDERSIINGVGPITVDPHIQNRRVGHTLMQAVIDRAAERHAAGIRLVQAAFHNRSFSLYAGLGFDVREQLACIQGTPRERSIAGCTVRPAANADQEACNRLSMRIHGYDRAAELEQAIANKTARVVERDGRITGYATVLGFFGHGTAETNPDLQALIASAERFDGSGILVPSRNTSLIRWCLANDLRVVQLMTLMTMGLYNEPSGAWLPSVSF